MNITKKSLLEHYGSYCVILFMTNIRELGVVQLLYRNWHSRRLIP